jgi:hypothetical protein
LLAICILGLPVIAAALGQSQEELQTQKLQLEIAALQKLATEHEQRRQLELRKLEREISMLERQPPPWLSPVLSVGATLLSVFGGLIAGFLGATKAATSAFNVARSNREGELDQAVHEQRLNVYPLLVQATAPLAIYFPGHTGALGPQHCEKIGSAMSKWYFAGGGILLSTEARNAYFTIVRALTRASRATELRTPSFPDDAADVSGTVLGQFRKNLAINTAAPLVDTWHFGLEVPASAPLEQKFRDYVFLQYLGSSLRTELASDIRSRRRPDDSPQ